MMKRLIVAIFVGLVALVPALPARGAEITQISFKGQTAEAFFHSVDGCADTLVFVFAVDGQYKETGHPVIDNAASVVIDVYDVCTNTQLLLARGSSALAPGQFQIDQQLTSASLNATADVTDVVSNRTFPVDITVTWTGSGFLYRFKDHMMLEEPGGLRIIERMDTYLRFADIPPGHTEGIVTDGVTDFASGSAYFGLLTSQNSGTIDIQHS